MHLVLPDEAYRTRLERVAPMLTFGNNLGKLFAPHPSPSQSTVKYEQTK